jgi:glycosyltransferase involved in cell wall biosynthesis
LQKGPGKKGMENNRKSEMQPLDLTVVICTHNRADYLTKAIHSLVNQEAIKHEFEILVVDNASTDATVEVVKQFSGLDNIRYLYEPKLGLCNARNAGWRNANGKYVAYLDDDAIASPGWVTAIRRAFLVSENTGIIGGRVQPIWEGERPGWLSDALTLGLTVIDWSKTAHVISDITQEWLVGANMAIPRDVLAEVGGFHPRLDRVGKNLLSGGDVFLQKQIIARGYGCLYVPDMAVHHLVPESRLDQNWFRRRYYWQGISDFVMRKIEHNPTRVKRLGHAVQMTVELLRSRRTLSCLLFSTDDPERFTNKCFALISIGHIAALLGIANTKS